MLGGHEPWQPKAVILQFIGDTVDGTVTVVAVVVVLVEPDTFPPILSHDDLGRQTATLIVPHLVSGVSYSQHTVGRIHLNRVPIEHLSAQHKLDTTSSPSQWEISWQGNVVVVVDVVVVDVDLVVDGIKVYLTVEDIATTEVDE